MRTLPALLLLPFLAAPAFAQGTSIELTDTVAGTTVTYLDLARVVAPDLEQVSGMYAGTVALPVRSIPYPDDAPNTALTLALYSAEATLFTSNGVSLIALLLDADNPDALGSSVVAVFDLAEPHKVIDLADVASDRFTSFDEPALLSLGDTDDGLLISSSHFNSSQGYRNTSVIALVDGKLTEVASVFTFNENYCGMRREQMRAFAPITTDAGQRWAPFTITVTETTDAGVNECGGTETAASGTRAAAATFRWAANVGRYQPDSTALDELFAETQARF